MRLSVCIPLYNEEDTIPQLIPRLDAALRGLEGVIPEIIFVNDGSTDATVERIRSLQRKEHPVTLINLSRNFGHQAALMAALRHASGDLVCLMDGDLQDEPEHIAAMVRRCQTGNDVVYAIRASRCGSGILKFFYRGFYRLLERAANIQIPPDAGDFCVMSRRVATFISGSEEASGFLRGLRAWAGFKQEGYPVARPERERGQSKYTFLRLIALGSRGILSFSTLPIRLVSIFGASAIALSACFAVYAVIIHFFFDASPSGFTALLISNIFLGGVQMLSLGVIGEYVALIFEQGKGRPPYLVDSVEEFAPEASDGS
ncbi:MAG: glycosyltransferase [Proteobacteria bacterium]|nr:glycosyltransferase [Pseudomonadota bacterium]